MKIQIAQGLQGASRGGQNNSNHSGQTATGLRTEGSWDPFDWSVSAFQRMDVYRKPRYISTEASKGNCLVITSLSPGPNFIELLSTEICWACTFFLDKNRNTNKIAIYCILFVTGNQLLLAYPENHVEIWLVIPFLSRKKFHAKQFFVFSSSMKLGPDLSAWTRLFRLKISGDPASMIS